MIPCAPVQWRLPPPDPPQQAAAPAPASAPGYAASLKPSRAGWITLPRWCVWVEPGGDDRWSRRWSQAVEGALTEWGDHIKIERVESAEDAHLRLWRRRPPLRDGRASNGRAYLRLQQVLREDYSNPMLEPQVEVLLSPGLRREVLQSTALHELGHGFGLWGHSSENGDVMATSQGSAPPLKLSPRDQQTLQWLLRQPSAVPRALPEQKSAQKEKPASAPPSAQKAD